MNNQFTKYERARILGARALQLSMDAPILLKLKKEDMENLNYDCMKIAEKELDEGVLPISINRPLPEKRESKLKAVKKENVEDKPEETEIKKEDIVEELVESLEDESGDDVSSSEED
jgi:DNA-directed RNA polymerase subunit K